MAGLVLSGILKTFVDPKGRSFEALRGIDLEIQSGECFSLLGPSGCGKTTLLRIIGGLERPDAGSVIMDGRDVTDLPPEKRPTTMVFQNYALFPHLTVEGNVSFGLKLRKKSSDEIRRKVAEALELVQLTGLNGRRVDELSGGQQQRVALARVLAVEPQILLMDEPLSNLDASLRRSTRSAIRQIQTDLGLTLIYVTHDQEEGLMISDRLALMMNGEILQTGTPRDLFDRPVSVEVATFLGQRNVVPALVHSKSAAQAFLGLGDLHEGPTLSVSADGAKLSAGDPVWLALKPDDIRLEKDSSASPTGWPGAVVLSSFAGTNVEIEVKLDGLDQPMRISFDPYEAQSAGGSPDFQRGDAVRLHVREGSGLIFSRDG